MKSSVYFRKEDSESRADVCEELNEKGNNNNLKENVDQISRSDDFDDTLTATKHQLLN